MVATDERRSIHMVDVVGQYKHYQDEIDEDFQRAMFESASRDALTQAYNKRFFLERLNSEFAFSVRSGLTFAFSSR